LEPGQEHHKVGVGELTYLARGQLHVVRFHAGLGEILHGGVIACYPLGDECERVERCRDGGAVGRGCSAGVAVVGTTSGQHQAGGCEERESAGEETSLHGRHSHEK
jgi:hypothetical protein